MYGVGSRPSVKRFRHVMQKHMMHDYFVDVPSLWACPFLAMLLAYGVPLLVIIIEKLCADDDYFL